MRLSKKKFNHPSHAFFVFGFLLVAMGALYLSVHADSSVLRPFPFLRWVRLIQSQLVASIFLFSVIVIVVHLFSRFHQQTKNHQSNGATLIVFFCLIGSIFPFCSLIVWGNLMYENWMWLCTAWTLSLGLFAWLFLWAINNHSNQLESIIEGLKQRSSFLVQPKVHPDDKPFLACVFLFIFFVCFIFNRVLLGGVPHVHDSVSQFFQATVFAHGSFTAPAPETPDFFQRLYILTDQERWYSIYPPGFTLLLAVGVFFHQPNVVNPLIVAAAMVPLFFLTAKISTAAQARMVVGFYALSPFTLIMGAGYMNHPTCLLFILIFVLSLLNSINEKSKKKFYGWGAISGFCLGYAYLTRPLTTFAFGILGGIWWLIRKKNRVLKRAVWAIVFLIGAAPPVVFQLTYNAKTTGSPWLSPYQKQYSGIPLGFGDVAWISNEVRPDRANIVHHTPLRGFSNSSRNLNGLNYWLFGWPVPCLVFAAMLFLPGCKRTLFDWLCLAAALSQSVAYAFYFYQDFCFGPRFLYETTPFWLILTARGINEVCSILPQRLNQSKQAVMGAFALLLTVFFLWALVFSWPERLRDLGDEYWGVRDEVYHMVTNQIQDDNAVIFVEYDYDYYAVFTLLDPWLESGLIVALDLGDERNRELIAQYPGWPVYRLFLQEDAPEDETITLIEPYNP